MAAYLIVHSKLTDPDTFQCYADASGDSVSSFGGKYVMGGTLRTVLEGRHDKNRTVIFQFPDGDDVIAWYNSDAYKQVKHLRDETGEFDFIVIDSFA